MDAFVDEFYTEAYDSLHQLDSLLPKLEKTPDDRAVLSDIYRHLHTVKGACGFLRVRRAETLTHHGEDILVQFRNGTLEITPESIDTLVKCVRRIRDILKDVQANEAPQKGDDESLIADLDGVLEKTIGRLWDMFAPMVKDLSDRLGKKIILQSSGHDIVIHPRIMREIKTPLVHIIRNACAHGIETPDERIKAGKDETGFISLFAFDDDEGIIIEVKDDGRGLQMARIKDRIIQMALCDSETLKTMEDKDIQQFIFTSGFSTASEVNEISGRGVGMDVVRNAIHLMNGSITLHSREGIGSSFKIYIPHMPAPVSD